MFVECYTLSKRLTLDSLLGSKMEGYFNIKVKFVIAVLLAVLFYVSYLYLFKEQTPDSFELTRDCTTAEIEAGTAKANLLFERYFEERILRDPEWQSRLGRKDSNNQWTSLSTEHLKIEHSYNQAILSYLEDSILREACLDEATLLSARLLKDKLKTEIEAYRYRYHNYPINAMNGVHLRIPALLINQHEINDLRDAEAYISRVGNVPKKIDELIAGLIIREKKGIILPKFLFPTVLASINEIIKTTPDAPNLIIKKFEQKIALLDLKNEQKTTLKQRLLDAFNQKFIISYQKLYHHLKVLETKASDGIGVWQWEAGELYYAFKLREQTTTSLTADEIYNLGIEEVARIHEEMRAIIKKLNYKGDLQAFFSFLRSDPQFYYPNTDKGRNDYLKNVRKIIDSMIVQLDTWFISKPNKDVVVRSIESFRESTFTTFYKTSVLGSNAPGVCYVNTRDMGDLPKYEMDVSVYHEAIPGHHLQISIEESLSDLPQFRRLEDSYTAYIEGWGMYAEYLPKEMGAYQDAYSDFGRLVWELWRACRLVVDVGIHHKKWTRNQAIDYYKENTPNQVSTCEKMVERHVVLPGQAVTYKVGMITILELRKYAETELGDQFDIREFHEVLLTNGKVPLDILQDLVEEYVQSKKD